LVFATISWWITLIPSVWLWRELCGCVYADCREMDKWTRSKSASTSSGCDDARAANNRWPTANRSS
jgi:hypothetical protein